MDDSSFNIGHNRWAGIGLVLVGGFSLALGLVAGTLVSVGVGAMAALVGFAYLFGTVAVVHDTEIELKNPLGMTVKRVQYAGRSAVAVRDGSLHVQTDGDSKKVLGGLSMHGADVARLQEWLAR